jgi:hypothetical protein
MSNRRIGFGGVLLCLVGFLAGANLPATTVDAQVAGDAEVWKIAHGRFGVSRDVFYAIKLNTATGEAWVMDSEGLSEDNTWMKLPERDQSAP